MQRVAGWGLLVLLGGCSLLGNHTRGCDSPGFTERYECLQQRSATELGMDATQRHQYLIYAEKLTQDMRLEGLSAAGALEALERRYQQLLQDPAQAEQCARFAERILCY